jgi:DNA repair photolyase
MARYRDPIRGRGTNAAPQNRFEAARFEPDEESGFADDETVDPRSQFIPDAARSALSKNQSPDVGFDVGLNPYRGCEHGCIYCLAPETPVLFADMIWRPLGDVRVGDILAGFDEHAPPGGARKLRRAAVLGVWWSRKPSWRLVTENAEVVTTAEHRWLQSRSFRWSRTEQLSPGRMLRRLPVVMPTPICDDYRAGYIAGLSLAVGSFGSAAAYWRIALVYREPLERLVSYLACFGIESNIRPFDGGARAPRALEKVEIRSLARLGLVSKILHVERSSAGYRRGFVAGFFDAEGSSSSSLRISQVDRHTLARVSGYARALGFDFKPEPREGKASAIRLVGSLAERIRFFSIFEPAIRRKIDYVWGHMPPTSPERIDAVERGRLRDVVDIQTTTGTFYAAGLATHNCYARPTHEYLGYSAGLDFETRILVKHELPELLRAALSAKSWKPQTIGISGVTDAYQPIERKLRLTRRALEVLADFRNPCSIITKSRLVARDADVLQELARHDAVSVTISLTSLDPELARRMEPRAAQPNARLWTIEQLAHAGVPVGVNLAPIVPGLTEHEIPALLAAAADAGAQWAGWQLVRLPYAVKDLFAEWLEAHYPDRREKVLHRIADVREGKLNDSRFGLRHRGTGLWSEQIAELVALSRRRTGLVASWPKLSVAAFRRPGTSQLTLF